MSSPDGTALDDVPPAQALSDAPNRSESEEEGCLPSHEEADSVHSPSKGRSRSPIASRSRSRSRSLSRSGAPRNDSHSPRRSRERSGSLKSRSRSYSSDRGRKVRSSSHRSRSRGREDEEYQNRSRGDPEWRRKLDDFLRDSADVREKDIASSTFDSLEQLTDKMAEVAVQRFCDSNFSRVKNKNGFFLGIIRRLQRDGIESQKPGDIDSLDTEVRTHIGSLIVEGRLKESDFDQRMCRALGKLSSGQAIEAIDKFANTDMDTIRSKTGYMIGIINRMGDPPQSRPRGQGSARAPMPSMYEQSFGMGRRYYGGMMPYDFTQTYGPNPYGVYGAMIGNGQGFGFPSGDFGGHGAPLPRGGRRGRSRSRSRSWSRSRSRSWDSRSRSRSRSRRSPSRERSRDRYERRTTRSRSRSRSPSRSRSYDHGRDRDRSRSRSPY